MPASYSHLGNVETARRPVSSPGSHLELIGFPGLGPRAGDRAPTGSRPETTRHSPGVGQLG